MRTKHLTALLAILTGATAHAEPIVTVYGTIDAGARYASGLGLSATSSPSPTPGQTASLASGVDRSGRFGVAGNEVLGDGYKAVFALETELYANTGSIDPNLGAAKDTAAALANKVFERQSFVGLAGPFGQLLVGRQQSVLRDIIDDIDAVGGRFSSFNPNLQYTALNSSGLVASAATFYGTGNPGNDSMMRQDNAIKYIAQSGPVTSTLLYSSAGVVGSFASGSSAEAALKYSQGPMLLAAAYQNMNNDNVTLKLEAYTLGGRYALTSWQFAANYGSNTAQRTPSIRIKTGIYSFGATYAATPALALTLGYYHVNRAWTDAFKPDANLARMISFAEYKFSKRTLAFAEIDFNKWGGDVTQFQNGAANKTLATGFTLGLDHTF